MAPILEKLAERERHRKQRKLVSRAAGGAPRDVWLMFDLFQREVIAGLSIDRRLQAAVNSIIASAITTRKLPKRPVGRPIKTRDIERQRATALHLIGCLEQGLSMTDAVDIVMEKMHRSNRRVYEHWKLHQHWARKHSRRQSLLSDYLRISSEILVQIGALRSESDLARLADILRQQQSDFEDVPCFRRAKKLLDED